MRRALVALVFLLCALAFFPGTVFGQVQTPCSDSLIPPFIAQGVKPNILIILANSNSMDEDFYGNGVGSWAPDSKSVIARQALQTVVANLSGYANVGIMTYTLPTSHTDNVCYSPFSTYTSPMVAPYYISNLLTFATYNSNAYCNSSNATGIQACVNWCTNYANGVADTADQQACDNACGSGYTEQSFSYPNAPQGTPNSGPFPDEIILDNKTVNPSTGLTEGSAYCATTYPKTSQMLDANGSEIYYNQALPLWSSSPLYPSTGYYFSGSDYTPLNYNPSTQSPTYPFDVYGSKASGTGDYTGYRNFDGTVTILPGDSAFARGMYNTGQQAYYYYVGPTWFTNCDVVGPSSGGQQQGYLDIAVGDLLDPTQYKNVSDLLEPNSGTPIAGDGNQSDSCNYMSCNPNRSGSFNMNACTDATGNPYIINAGNSPTAGALASALDYFEGSYSGFCFNSSGMSNGQMCSKNNNCNSSYPNCSVPSPITASCQQNYIILLTDGLPDTELNGDQVVPITQAVMNQVVGELTALHQGVTQTIGNKTYTFPINTYVLGVGSEATENAQFDAMAVAGGTAVNGHAYYGANPDQLAAALKSITANILGKVAAGSSVSILSQGETQNGANMLQGVFYPSKYFGTTLIDWPGYLYNWWFYSSPSYENIRENNANDNIFDLKTDYGLDFTFSAQTGLTVDLYSDPTGSGNPTQPVPNGTGLTLDQLDPIWEGGKLLFATPAADRTIYTPGTNSNGSNLVSFDTTNTSLTTAPSPLGNPSNFDACLDGSTDNLINYIRGTDIKYCSDGANIDYTHLCTQNSDCSGDAPYTTCANTCRNRTVGLCSDGNGDYSNTACNSNSDCSGTYDVCTQHVWKLGDIVYSTPKVEVGYSYCGTTDSNGDPVFDSNSTLCSSNSDCADSPSPDTQCLPKESLVFVGANDGMLHAFETGTLNNYGLTGSQVERITGIPTSDMGQELWAFVPRNSLPYLRCLANPAGCHLYYNDLSPYITTMQEQTGTDANGNPIYTPRIVLIGGMRLGGGSETGSGNFCMNSAGVSNGTTCSNTGQCSSQGYCLDSAGATDGQACTQVSDCAAPYNANCSAFNASCSGGYSTNVPADTCAGSVITCSNPTTCYSDPVTGHNGSNCVGLSSYYALDITDPNNPKLLWEFSDPFLGYTYSGPAVIHKWAAPGNPNADPPVPNSGNRYYVMFLSGPTDAADGSSTQDLYAFVLSLDPKTLDIDSVYTQDFTGINNGFGGRLFTNGLDVVDPPVNGLSDPNGYTDFVFFGYEYAPDGKTGSWKGGIAKVWTGNTDPSAALDPSQWTWDVTTYANLAQLPITAQVATETCFNNPTTGMPQWYLYAGTGRYFYPLDAYGSNGQSSVNYIMGIPFTCDQNNNNCGKPNLNSLNQNSDACSALQQAGTTNLSGAGWLIDLDTPPASSGYLYERAVTDPTTSEGNTIYFTTSEPTSNPCGYGGQSRVWGLNCATGGEISDNSCSGYVVNNSQYTGSIFLQTSTGAIETVNNPGTNGSGSNGSFNGKTTGWYQGMPPESSPQKIAPSTSTANIGAGQLIQWYEK
ncbi:MAG: hypothetical protein M0Z81_02275 [Deltaproteobacteria bacterium]|jgi:Tfp pilus tip-associated adhesin PilY1|nr:hypothetical protein [Deltaproteobacteria bacterium]